MMDPEVKKHNYLPVLITVLVMLFVVALISGGIWYYMDQQAKKSAADNAKQVAAMQKQINDLNNRAAATSSTTARSASNVFNLNTVKIGDKVAGMTVTSVGKALTTSPLPYGNQNAQITFSGQATVEGTYAYSGDDQPSIITDFVSFAADPSSFSVLPTIGGDSRAGFGFSNPALAKSLFGITTGKSSSGKSKVTISDYKFVIFPGEGSNSATLISISK
jgi:archaellum component FlaF (FlaF/FlaG flagellin family)